MPQFLRMLAASLGLLGILAASPLPALAQGGTGQISGVVRDELGGVLPGVTLTLRHQASGVQRVAVTEGDGTYRFPALGPGLYTLKSELPSFASEEVVDIEITIGLALKRDFRLRLQTLQEAIVVQGQAPVVDTTKSEVSGVVTQRQIETLPINSRSYLSLALLMPGTTVDATRAFFPTVNVGGSMTFNSTGNYVDGMINNFAEDGEPRQNLPQDAVEEFKVSNVQFKAEFGLATGGLVQVVTKSGTNAFRGNVFESFRDKALNSLNRFETQKPDFRRHQYGGSLGGAIQKDRSHFYGAVERTRIEEFFTVSTRLPQLYSALEGTFEKPFHRNMYFGRVDYQINNAQNVFVRYAHEDEKSTCGGCGGINAANQGFDQETPRRAVVASHTWIRGARQLNDLRFQYARAGYFIAPAGTSIYSNLGDFGSERLGRHTVQLNFPSLRWGSGFDELGPESRWQLKDTYALSFAKHELKMGADISYMPYTEEVANNLLGSFTFSRDQFFDGSPQAIAALTGAVTFSAQVPPLSTERPTKYYVGFVQDDWKIQNNVTLNLGLRYERLYGCCNEDLDPSIFPISIPYIDVSQRGDTNNFGPRAGFAWDIRSDGETVVRGGYGLYYGHVRILGNLNEFRNYQRFSVSISNPAYPDPYGGRAPLSFASTAPANITVVANDYVQPFSHQFNIGFSHRLPANFALHVDAIVQNTEHDRKTQDINARVAGVRPNRTFARVDRNQSTGEVKYRALYTKLEKRFSARTQMLASYTFTNSDDNNPGARYLDPVNEELDRGPSNGERRHAIIASGSVLLPADITLGAVWTWRSQLPWTATAGLDLNADGFNTDLVPGTARNDGSRGLDVAAVNAWRARNNRAAISEDQIDSSRVSIVDVRISKPIALRRTMKAELMAQVFNALNTDNLQDQFGGGRIGNALSANFGRIQTARPGRQGELGIRLIW